MVMGPTHAMSGAAAALAGIAVYTTTVGPVEPVLGITFTVMAAGAAVAPDIDSFGSTIVRSFGIFGKVAYHIANSLSVAVHGITATRKDGTITNGHRTLFHTTVMAIVMGGLVALATSPTNTVDLWGQNFSWGQVNAIVLMSIFLNLSMAGLLEKRIKKARKQFGPYLLMLGSVVGAIAIAVLMPPPDGSYAFLGIAVGFGWFIHLLGDAITKMGVPIAWPLKIAGKRWYDIATPPFMRITAGEDFEKKILLPVITFLTIGLLIYNVLVYFGVFQLFKV